MLVSNNNSVRQTPSTDPQSPGGLNKDILSQFSYGFDQFQIESCLSLEAGGWVGEWVVTLSYSIELS